jgi:hypothetical protein
MDVTLLSNIRCRRLKAPCVAVGEARKLVDRVHLAPDVSGSKIMLIDSSSSINARNSLMSAGDREVLLRMMCRK